jgi:alpha-beta hydrolase superfamily lysophospholipase
MWIFLWACTTTPVSQSDTGAVDLDALFQVGVEKWELPYVDASRSTAAFIDLPASDVRTLTTWVWLPPGRGEDLADRPLVLLAHGNGGHPELLVPLAEGLAAHGAVVAAPIFPATNRYGDSAGLALPDLYNQPEDLAFVRAALGDSANDPASPLYRRVAVDRAIAVGHSLGGATVAGWTRWGDDPQTDLLATVLVAPATFLNAPFGEGPHAAGPPLQLVHGDADSVIAVSVSEELMAVADDPVALVVMPGVGHSEPFEGEGVAAMETFRLVRGVFDTVTGADPGAWEAALSLTAERGNLVSSSGL